jgi:hypothetical protein
VTEQEWMTCNDPGPMLDFLQGKATDRKMRLFAVACCRRVWYLLSDERSRSAVHAAEHYADGLTTPAELTAAQRQAMLAYIDGTDAFYGLRTDITRPHSTAPHAAALHAADAPPIYMKPAADSAAYSVFKPHSFPYPEAEATAAVAPERVAQAVLIRDIFGPLPFRPVTVHPDVLAWNDRLVVRLAQSIYEERRWGDMPILGDALLDAGCDNEEVMVHCRAGGEHVRGCWVVDLLLGKS